MSLQVLDDYTHVEDFIKATGHDDAAEAAAALQRIYWVHRGNRQDTEQLLERGVRACKDVSRRCVCYGSQDECSGAFTS